MATNKNTWQQFMAYLQNSLADKERHAFEKNSLSDPFEEEALEGMETLAPEILIKDLQKLQQRFAKPIPKKGLLVSLRKYRMAASILLVVGLGALLYFTLSPEVQEIPAAREFDSNQIIVNDFDIDTISEGDAIVVSEETEETILETPVSEAAPQQSKTQAPPTTSTPEPVKTFIIAKSKRTTTRGTITNNSKEPLPGIQISIKGKDGSVTSDFDGNFNIDSEPNDTLIFDGLGFEKAFRPSDDAMTVVMEEREDSLEEVVVVGYGTVQKKDLTGAVTAIDETSPKDTTIAATAIPPQGSVEAYKMWLLEQLSSRYKKAAIEDEIHIEFTVDKKGQLIDFKHTNKKNKRLLKKLKKLVLESPAWQPAEADGEAISAEIRIEFKNENE